MYYCVYIYKLLYIYIYIFIYAYITIYHHIYIYDHIYIYICITCITGWVSISMSSLFSGHRDASGDRWCWTCWPGGADQGGMGGWEAVSCRVHSFWQEKWMEYIVYPLVNIKSYWKWPFIVDFSIKNGDFPVRYVKLPEGNIFVT